MKKLIFFGLLVLAMVSPCLAEGAQEEAEQKTVNLFISGKSVWGEPMNTVVKKFSESYPNITVEVEVVGGGVDYHPVLASRARTKTLPDIFMIAGAGDFEGMGRASRRSIRYGCRRSFSPRCSRKCLL